MDRVKRWFAFERAASARFFAACLTASLLSTIGCQQSDSTVGVSQPQAPSRGKKSSLQAVESTANANASARPTLKPNELLSRMVDAYHKASSYADAAQLRIVIEREGQASDPEPINASVSFVRPNKARIQCLDAMMVCDGKKLRASVGTVDKQVLELDAPATLGIGNLYLGDAFYDSLAQGIGGFPIQIALLLDPNAILPEGSNVSTIEPRSFDGHRCQRVKIDMADGSRVYWIDDETSVLRLVELPTEMMRKQLEAAEGPVKRVAVTLELLGARLDQPVPDEAFQFEAPAGAQLVKQLIRPPHPASPLLGKSIGDFKFTGINGSAVSKKSTEGKVTVVDFWFTGCGPCREAFPLLAKVYDKYKASDKVAFVSVSVDEPGVDDKQIQDTAAAWGANFPLARDTSGGFQAVFEAAATPALFVLGPDGTVQFSEVGLNPALPKELPETIDALLAGKSTWEAAKARDKSRQDEYARRIQQPPASFTAVEDLPATKILPRDEPKTFKLEQAWEAEVKRPGNILVVDAADVEPKLFVLDGARAVVELSKSGQIVARHELKIPEQAAISYLRTTIDKSGKRYFAGCGNGQQQLFLFDADWNLLLSFPAADQGKHAGIGDVQFIDQEQLGTPHLAIGYWGVVGVQCVSLDGKRLWADRTTEFIISLTETGADSKGLRTLLCANGQGQIVPINSTGAPQGQWSAQGIMFENVLAAEMGGPQKPICAAARNSEGTPLAVGLSPRGDDLWRYVLPRGIFRTPIEPLSVGSVVGSTPHWLIAGADGSIHFISPDGTPLDHFHYGEALSGIAGIRSGDERLLIVSTAKGLTAWRASQ